MVSVSSGVNPVRLGWRKVNPELLEGVCPFQIDCQLLFHKEPIEANLNLIGVEVCFLAFLYASSYKYVLS